MTNRYPGRCEGCGGQIGVAEGEVRLVDSRWHLHHRGECPTVLSTHASGNWGLAKNIAGHEFKPDASAPIERSAHCANCGTAHGVAWISGAGRYLCYRHQDDY